MSDIRVGAAIVAAGTGSRFGKPKQFELLSGRALFLWSVEAFITSGLVHEVVLVVNPDREQEALQILAQHGLDHVVVIGGGATRQQSVQNALKYFDHEGQATHVLVHDAARALVSQGLIDRSIRTLETEEAVLVALPVVDTLKQAVDDRVAGTVSRENLWRAQTPQGGVLELLLNANRVAESEGYQATDESELLERVGVRPALVVGSERNFKITYPEDLIWAERLLNG